MTCDACDRANDSNGLTGERRSRGLQVPRDPRDGDAMGPSGECALRGTRSLGLSPRDRNLELEKPPEGNPRHGDRPPERN